MNKEKFIKPEIHVIELLFEDIITCSSVFDPNGIMEKDDDQTIEMY